MSKKPPEPPQRFGWPIPDAAAAFGVSVRTIYELIDQKVLEVIHIGARITRIKDKSIVRLADEGLPVKSVRKPRKPKGEFVEEDGEPEEQA